MRFALLLVAVVGWAQTFEVATVKPRDPDSKATPGCHGGPNPQIQWRLVCVSSPLTELITIGYDVKFYAIEAADWMNTYANGFDIQALIPAGTTKAQYQVMVQNLLAERWRMRVHREERQVQGYSLTASKPRLKPADPNGKPGIKVEYGLPIRAQIRREPMAEFVKLLEVQVQGPVTDDTNLSGEFDFDLEFIPERRAAAGAPGLDLFAALRDLGLTLRAAKVPLSVIVIDSADKTPTAN